MSQNALQFMANYQRLPNYWYYRPQWPPWFNIRKQKNKKEHNVRRKMQPLFLGSDNTNAKYWASANCHPKKSKTSTVKDTCLFKVFLEKRRTFAICSFFILEPFHYLITLYMVQALDQEPEWFDSLGVFFTDLVIGTVFVFVPTLYLACICICICVCTDLVFGLHCHDTSLGGLHLLQVLVSHSIFLRLLGLQRCNVNHHLFPVLQNTHWRKVKHTNTQWRKFKHANTQWRKALFCRFGKLTWK